MQVPFRRLHVCVIKTPANEYWVIPYGELAERQLESLLRFVCYGRVCVDESTSVRFHINGTIADIAREIAERLATESVKLRLEAA